MILSLSVNTLENGFPMENKLQWLTQVTEDWKHKSEVNNTHYNKQSDSRLQLTGKKLFANGLIGEIALLTVMIT